LKDVQKIKEALGIRGVSTDISRKGMQIDLVLDRKDAILNLCEAKCSQSEYVITKDYFEKLHERMRFIREYSKTKKAVTATLITPKGVKEYTNMPAVSSVVTTDNLFSRNHKMYTQEKPRRLQAVRGKVLKLKQTTLRCGNKAYRNG